MNFDPNEEQSMLRSLAERFAKDRRGVTRRRQARSLEQGFCPESWATLGKTGLLSALLPERASGFSLGPAEIIFLFEELGRGLTIEPLAEAMLGAAALFLEGADSAQLEEWREDLTTGERRLALAHAERQARYNLANVETVVEGERSHARLTGQKIGVAHAIGADGFIVSARPAVSDQRDSISLYLVAGDAAGLRISPYRQLDGSVAAVLDFQQVVPLAALGGGIEALHRAQNRLSLAQSAEAVGIMDMLLSSTLDYLHQRKQFGRQIGSFQAVQHRMASQYLALEKSRSLLYWAAVDDQLGQDREQRITGARSFILEAAIGLGHEAIQLHGGMGVTDEFEIGHAHKRLLQIARCSEPPEVALDRFAGILA